MEGNLSITIDHKKSCESKEALVGTNFDSSEEMRLTDSYNGLFNYKEDGGAASERKTTNIESMIHVLKGNIGPGFLALPSALKNGGIILGSTMILVLGAICIHCMHLLLKCSRRVTKRTGKKSVAYAEIAELAFEAGPRPLWRFSGTAKFIVNLVLCATQLGICSVYFVFVSKNVKQVVEHYTYFEMSLLAYMALMLPIAILLCYIKNLKALAPASTFANIIQLSGICIVFYNVSIDIPNIKTRRYAAAPSLWPVYFGTVLFAFEGIGLVTPIENAMETPEAYPGLTGVLNTSMSLVTLLFFAVGFYGYLKYGDDIKGSITLNPVPSPMNDYARIAFSLSVLITYSLQFYVSYEILWKSISVRIPSNRLLVISDYALRTVLVVLTFLAAALIPHLDIVISLIGAVGSSALCIIFPPILEMLIDWPNNYGIYNFKVFKNIALVLIGILGSISGTYVAVKQAVEAQPES